MTALDALDAEPVPTALMAVTVNVYAVPFVRPVTVQLSGPVVHEQDRPPGLAVTVYAMIVAPPVLVGADQETSTCPLPAVPTTPVGAPGSVVSA